MPLLTFSILFALVFALAARRKGYKSARIWLFPLVTGIGLFLAATLLIRLAGGILENPSSAFVRFYPALVEAVSYVLYLVLIFRGWTQLRRLPSRS